MKWLLWVVIVACVTLRVELVQGAVFRYAIVVGSNSGAEGDGHQPFAPLLHAEREARVLRDRLVSLANFSDSTARTALLLGPTKAEVLAAAKRLAAQRADDERRYGQIDSLFAFFFTGHGQSGRLLLRDGPLTTAELAKIFRDMHATIQLGVFDACFSGSMDEAVIASKGVAPTPGVNLFRELPEEVLMAQGSVWLVSSRANEVSYEDRELGGLFTHFFIEALDKAQIDGAGITLESIWNYTRRKTTDYTAAYSRQQRPEQLVVRLKTRGPLYFSFPTTRTARLVLNEGLVGDVVLDYADGQLVDTAHKEKGQRQELRVFAGDARVRLMQGDQVVMQENLRFEPGSVVVLRPATDSGPLALLGHRSQELWTKGAEQGALRATAIVPDTSLSTGVELRRAVVARGMLTPTVLATTSLRLDRANTFVSALLGYGGSVDDFDTWSYRMHAVQGALQTGVAVNLGRIRLTTGPGVSASYMWQRFGDGSSRQKLSVGAPWGFAALLALGERYSVEIAFAGGPLWAPGIGRRAGSTWVWYGNGGVAMRLRL